MLQMPRSKVGCNNQGLLIHPTTPIAWIKALANVIGNFTEVYVDFFQYNLGKKQLSDKAKKIIIIAQCWCSI